MNERESIPRRVYARPADRSLQAYKDFILTILAAVSPDAIDDQSEEQWQAAWQKFWNAADNAAPHTSEEEQS